ncbi:MAG: hypothetical protein PUB69_03775, partial [Desulfovibrionaceae bacterium]|nr:hypothetical protein [Desulfovibrionaceae bacterium]
MNTQIVKPLSGQTLNITPDTRGKICFDFPTDAAVFSKNGDALVISFDDGGVVNIVDFYKLFTSKNLPNFEISGSEVSGSDFFAMLQDPTLMPAAGPQSSFANRFHFHQYSDLNLVDGLDRLGGEDVAWKDESFTENRISDALTQNDDTPVVNTTVSLSASDINEGESSVTYTVTLSNAAQTDAVVTVNVGGTDYTVNI